MPEKTPPAKPTIDTRVCPLCGQSNQCANEVQRETGVAQGPCWCTTAVFERALLERIPEAYRRLACVCARCASAAADSAAPPPNPPP